MRKVGPCKILAEYGPSAYQEDLPTNIEISTTFNVVDLVAYKGPPPSSTLAKDVDL